MLSRHFLRAKVLQEVYAYHCNETSSLLAAQDALMHNIERLNDLGSMQLAMLLELMSVAERVTDDAMTKFTATEAERNPDRRLLNNEFLRRMADNYELKRLTERVRNHWGDEQPMFRKIYLQFLDSEAYKNYMGKEVGFEADKDVALQLFRVLVNDEGLRSTVVEQSLLWEDDFDQVAQYIFMMLKTLNEENMDEAMPWPKVYDSRNPAEVEAVEFAKLLLKETLSNSDRNNEMIKQHLKGWEFERVALMDILLLDMAMAELEYCPSIPERVTVDEYIELSKEFSTDKSKLFINGLLDKVIIEMRSAGRIEKDARGLYNPDLFDDEKEESL